MAENASGRQRVSRPPAEREATHRAGDRDLPVLTAADLSVGYRPATRRERLVLEGLTFALHANELVCILGPNGCGKSTLLRTVAGLLPPLRGSVRLRDRQLEQIDRAERARRIAVVLTDRVDPGFLTLSELVALGRFPYTRWDGKLNQSDHKQVEAAIDALDLQPLRGRHLAELSDGERQKAMIARALAQQPELLVLDEPTAFLDLPSRVEILQLLRRRVGSGGEAVILSTHELESALRIADRLWLIGSDGTLTGGAPEDLVLNGAIGRTFARDGVEFDRATAAFRPVTRPRGRIILSGSGVGRQWTARALERVGFEVSAPAERPQSEGPEILVQTITPGCSSATDRVPLQWRLVRSCAGSEEELQFASLEALTGFLRTI